MGLTLSKKGSYRLTTGFNVRREKKNGTYFCALTGCRYSGPLALASALIASEHFRDIFLEENVYWRQEYRDFGDHLCKAFKQILLTKESKYSVRYLTTFLPQDRLAECSPLEAYMALLEVLDSEGLVSSTTAPWTVILRPFIVPIAHVHTTASLLFRGEISLRTECAFCNPSKPLLYVFYGLHSQTDTDAEGLRARIKTQSIPGCRCEQKRITATLEVAPRILVIDYHRAHNQGEIPMRLRFSFQPREVTFHADDEGEWSWFIPLEFDENYVESVADNLLAGLGEYRLSAQILASSSVDLPDTTYACIAKQSPNSRSEAINEVLDDEWCYIDQKKVYPVPGRAVTNFWNEQRTLSSRQRSLFSNGTWKSENVPMLRTPVPRLGLYELLD